MHEIFSQFGIIGDDIMVVPNVTGLINRTWRINTKDRSYILQQVNTAVFPDPAAIAQNIRSVGDYLKQNHPGYLFVQPLAALDGKDLVSRDEGYFRLFPYIEGSHTIDVVETPAQAYEAAKTFGRFTRLLSGFDATQLNTTLPRFHDLHLRFQQFEDALRNKNMKRIQASTDFILYLLSQRFLLDEYDQAILDCRIRVTHHDTKISNVLFDEKDKGLCVIDLDTLMPGYFFSDLGDMLRTYLSPVNEEERDFSLVSIRKPFYDAIIKGYTEEMGETLSEAENKHFLFAGKFMVWMQALRFLTDHLNNDVYYGARYENHNLVRAGNQATLLKRLMEFEKSL